MFLHRFVAQPSGLLCGFALLSAQAVLVANAVASDSSYTKSNEVKLPVQVSSATGFRQQALMAPSAITVIDKEQISRAPVSELGEVFRDVPGVDRSEEHTSELQSR